MEKLANQLISAREQFLLITMVRKKARRIGSGAFIGSNSSLVAPLKGGKNSMIGAGSVVTKDVPENKLAFEQEADKGILRENNVGSLRQQL